MLPRDPRIRLPALLAMVLAAVAARGQGAAPAVRAAAAAAPAPLALDVNADRLDYEGDGKYLVGQRNVVVRYGGHTLRCDYVQVNTVTEDVYAKGRVRLQRPDGTTWQGEELVYNFKTGLGDFGKFTLHAAPFYVYGEDSELVAPNVVALERVTVTPCEGPAPETKIRARSATVTDQRFVRARHAAFYLGRVPFLYLPVYKKDLKGDGRWDFLPGYSSRLGPFLLTAYNYSLNEGRNVKGATLLNAYGERGIGVGQELKWRNTNQVWRGFARGFWIDDSRPFRNDAEEARRSVYLEDSQRYRLRLGQTAQLGPLDTFQADATYLSDPWIQRDFFREEYRLSPQPENRVTLSRRTDRFTASLQVNKRLNDFYDNVDRLPEARLDVPQLRLGESPLYYEAENSAANLERVYPEAITNDSYRAVRIDSRHMVSMPRRLLDFLTLTPRAGYRGTYYSETYEDAVSTTNYVVTVDTNTGAVATTPVVSTVRPDGGAGFRSLWELGGQASFKAFKVLDPGDTQWGRGLRHVAEPYADYTYRPEPDLLPANLPQFDAVDRVGQQHDVRLGLRNKLQTRLQGDRVHDLVDADVYTTYRVEKLAGQTNDFGPIVAKVELRPTQRFFLDFDGQYDLETSRLAELNVQAALVGSDRTSLAIEHRYRVDQRDLLAAELKLWPERKWSFGAYARYEFETSQLEEHSYYLQHRMDCLGWTLGVRHEPAYDDGTGQDQEDDFSVWLQVWILTMPGSSVQLGG